MMALRINLKPNERMIVGGAVLTNGNKIANFTVENRVPILREKDIMNEKEADSPCRRIYFVVQLMYIDEQNLNKHHGTYWRLVKEILAAAPSTLKLIEEISDQIRQAHYYQALKITKKLIEYEKELLNV